MLRGIPLLAPPGPPEPRRSQRLCLRRGEGSAAAHSGGALPGTGRGRVGCLLSSIALLAVAADAGTSAVGGDGCGRSLLQVRKGRRSADIVAEDPSDGSHRERQGVTEDEAEGEEEDDDDADRDGCAEARSAGGRSAEGIYDPLALAEAARAALESKVPPVLAEDALEALRFPDLGRALRGGILGAWRLPLSILQEFGVMANSSVRSGAFSTGGSVLFSLRPEGDDFACTVAIATSWEAEEGHDEGAWDIVDSFLVEGFPDGVVYGPFGVGVHGTGWWPVSASALGFVNSMVTCNYTFALRRGASMLVLLAFRTEQGGITKRSFEVSPEVQEILPPL